MNVVMLLQNSVAENWNPVYGMPSWTAGLQLRKPPFDFSQHKLLFHDKFMRCTTFLGDGCTA
jgi:hypothetical protein